MTKKEFALQEIAPYYKDPSICGINEDTRMCMNLTKDGRMCVAGKNYLPHIRGEVGTVNDILMDHVYDQSEVFIPESVDILSTSEWNNLQNLHDNIACKIDSFIEQGIKNLNLFTLEELKEYAEKL